MATAYDLGEIDEDWFSGEVSSITLEGLNMDNGYDEDWFTWDADDDVGDSPEPAAYIYGDDLTYYILELYAAKWDTTHPIASAEGYGNIEVSQDDFPEDFEPSVFDTGWDIWWISVRTEILEWDEYVCVLGGYDLRIES